jgi:hypothetical protein
MAGLGDRIARVTAALGIPPCEGCKERQRWLNEHFPGKAPRLPEGFEERALKKSAGRTFLLAENPGSGSWVVWEVLSGRLVNGFFFCAACGAEASARKEFARRMEAK